MPRAKLHKFFNPIRKELTYRPNLMHYNLPGGIIVKSENAAKPASQTSKYLIAMLEKLPQVNRTLDYGCGKLRYYDSLLQTTQLLTLVDSEVQISRQQKLRGTRTSTRDIFRASNRVSVFNINEFAESRGIYDRVFCINVLSAIPVLQERQKLLIEIERKLESGAECIFVVQYRNSDFTRMSKMPNAKPWLDGFLINSLRGYSFYALIKPKALVEMLEQAGFLVVSQKLNEGTAYVWAKQASDKHEYIAPLNETDLKN